MQPPAGFACPSPLTLTRRRWCTPPPPPVLLKSIVTQNAVGSETWDPVRGAAPPTQPLRVPRRASGSRTLVRNLDSHSRQGWRPDNMFSGVHPRLHSAVWTNADICLTTAQTSHLIDKA